jgi:outer membrane protein assembly factor BamB
MSDVKSADPKVEAPPSSGNGAEVKPAEVKIPEAKPASADLPAGTPAKAEAAAGKPAELKAVDAAPVAAKAAAAEAPKPAEPKPVPAKAEVKAPEAKPAEAKPAEAKPAEAKPAEAKPAHAKPAEAKAPEVKPAAPAAPAVPAPGTIGSRAPAAKTAEQNISITISAKSVAMIMGGLVMVVIVLFGSMVYLLVRLTDRQPLSHVVDQVPGMDGTAVAKPVAAAAGAEAAKPAETLEKVEIGANFKEGLGGKPSELKGSWPAFRGPKYDNIGAEISLANRWPKGGPPVKWSISDLGEGYSGAAVNAGRVYLQDYDGKGKEEILRCFSFDDGKEIWRRSYVMPIVNSHGFTRTVPAVTDKYVVMMGSMCHVLCVDAQTGAMKWAIDLMKDYGTHNMASLWYTAQCPIIEDSVAVLAPCGKDVLMMGIDCETGKVLWKTPNPKALQMSHSSISPMVLNGKRQYVYCAEWGKIVGISAEKDSVGTQLWESSSIDKQVISPSPVILEDGHIFMTAGYSGGSAMLKVTEAGGKYEAKTLWKLDEKEGLSCEQQTPIYFNKHLFGLCPGSAGARKEQLVCMNPFDKGKVVWDSGKEKRFGQYESMLLADGKFYVLDKDASLIMVKANTQKYEELGRCKLLQGHEAWAPIALVGNLMLLRDSKVMICIDIGKGIE